VRLTFRLRRLLSLFNFTHFLFVYLYDFSFVMYFVVTKKLLAQSGITKKVWYLVMNFNIRTIFAKYKKIDLQMFFSSKYFQKGFIRESYILKVIFKIFYF